MTETSLIHARINGHLNAQAMAVLDALGLAAPDAVRLPFHLIVADQAFLVELSVPNAKGCSAMDQSYRTMMNIHTGRMRSRRILQTSTTWWSA